MRVLRLLEDTLVELLDRSLTRDAALTVRVLLLSLGYGSLDRLAVCVRVVETARDPRLGSYRRVEARSSAITLSRSLTREKSADNAPSADCRSSFTFFFANPTPDSTICSSRVESRAARSAIERSASSVLQGCRILVSLCSLPIQEMRLVHSRDQTVNFSFHCFPRWLCLRVLFEDRSIPLDQTLYGFLLPSLLRPP